MTVLDKLARPWPAVVVTLTLVLTACGAGTTASSGAASASTSAQESQSTAPEPNELTVLEWSGYEAPDFWTDFQKASPDTQVDFEFGISDADILTQMEGGSSADVFHFYTGWQKFYVDEGLVQEIDTSKLKNWDKVPDSFKQLGQIDGKQYFIPWDWGFTSIMYNTDHVKNVDSWDVLFDPQYKGHISMWNDGPAAVSVSAYVHGWDETAITDDQLATIEQEWVAQKPLNKFYWSGEYVELCPNSGPVDPDIWIAYAWQGCYATSLSQDAPVAYANPKEGRNSWVGLYGISANSESPELALKFLDDKLADLSCSNAMTLFYYGCVNQDVMDAVKDPILIQAFALDDPSILERTNFTPLVTQEQRDAWTQMWSRVQAE
jgi:spermidine/putrescine transport system substrate-binding protein